MGMKKILIKENELENFVKGYLKENVMPTEGTLNEMLEEKYQEIISEVKIAIENNDVDLLDEIYDAKIFEITKSLHKNKNLNMVNKFMDLEESVINYIEINKQYSIIRKDLNESSKKLRRLF
jgi:hypothetical protein